MHGHKIDAHIILFRCRFLIGCETNHRNNLPKWKRSKRILMHMIWIYAKKAKVTYGMKWMYVVLGSLSLHGNWNLTLLLPLFADDTQIVFNVVASVKFNEKLRDAVDINVLGTKKILDLVMGMKNLKVITINCDVVVWMRICAWFDGECHRFCSFIRNFSKINSIHSPCILDW